MEQQTTVKVYELAKELGMDSFSLLDKLSGLNIKVKSHMSELPPEDVQKVREALDPSRKSAGATPARKAATRARKKATATDSAAAPATPAPEKPVAGATAAAGATSAAAPSSAAVIRRRVKADGEVETAARGVNLGRTVHAEAGEGEEEEQAAAAEQAAAEQAANEQYAAEQAAYEPVVAAEAPAEVAAEAPGTTEVGQEAPGSEPALGVEAAPIATAASEAGAPALVEAKPAAGSPVAKKPPVILPPRPVAPRKSFLKIVEPSAPPPKPRFIPPVTPGLAPSAGGPKVTPRGTPGAPTPDRDGFRVIKMNKEGIDQLAEEEAAKKRGGGGREVEIKPEDVRFADYRKKEMIFLPKRKRLPVGREVKRTQLTTAAEHKRVVEMPGDTITIQDLASQMSVKAIDVVRKLMQMGQMVNINASVDRDSASLVATEFKHEVKNTAFKEEEFIEVGVTDTAETLHARPPVVTIMGHVDHGKTSLLDAIRSAKVAAGEAGGITQHIGAYTVEKDGKLITFVDTPGHEAFTAMRARGANVTDIVILVVAADDGVMPQTREALSHAQAAGVPIIVAVNKIDKPGAQPDRVMQQLSELNLLPEEWGGQTMFVPVSALKQTNLDKLLESVLLQAEVLDLKANPDAQASGSVLESRLEKGRGPVASVLVKRGTLRVGDAIVSGPHWGKVRAMMDDKGNPVQEVTPGVAAEILGFESLPMAGERFDAPESVPDAQRIAEVRQDKERSQKVAFKTGVSLEQLFAKVRAGEVKELGVVLKADVFGSVEAIKDSLLKLSTDKVKVKVLFSAPGGITESDVLLASASDAIIIGFNVRPETKARQMAEAQHVEIKTYSIIYELIDDVKAAMTGMLDKKKVERFLGRAEVRQTFSVPKIGTIAGSSVIDGKIIRGANVRLLRESRIIYEGKMSSLKRFKDDAKEVAQGFECGIGLENYNDLKPGDLIEAYQIDLVAPELGA